MIEIRMKIAGEDVLFASCGRCEEKHWMTAEGPLAFPRVLEMARAGR
jgi:hypothetical protein